MVSEQPTKKMIRLLKDAGFMPGRKVGSHTNWSKGALSVSVPDGHRTISPGVVRQINNTIKLSKEQQ